MMYITSAFSAAIILTYFSSAWTALIFAVIIALFLLFYDDFSRRKMSAFLVIVSFLSGVLCFAWHDSQDSIFKTYINEMTTVVCDVLTVTKKETSGFDGRKAEYLQIKAVVVSVERNVPDRKEKIIINCYENMIPSKSEDSKVINEVIPGARICVKGMVKVPEGRSNPGCFDYSLYLRSVGVEYLLSADRIKLYDGAKKSTVLKATESDLVGRIYKVKENFLSKIEDSAGEKASGTIRAVMFGEKIYLDEETLDEFRRNGTAHVLAVSGLHIGMIYGLISVLWRWKKGKLYLVFVMIFFLIYMAMASFTTSIIRAVIMIWLHAYAQLTNRRYDMASAAFFTGLIMLINEPMHIFNAGFQMSFLAVLTLSLILPLIKRFYSGMFMASAAIQMGLYPYTIYVFNYFSAAAVFVNVPIIFLTGIIVPCGICCMVVMFIFEPLGSIIAKAMGGMCIIMEKLNSLTCVDGVTVFDVKSPDIWLVAAYYLSLLFFVSEDGRLLFMRKRKRIIKLLICFVVMTSLIFGYISGNQFKHCDVVFVDVGQGDCIHIRTDKSILRKNSDYLIDGGGSINYEVGKKTLKPYLLKNGVKKIDGAFVTHLHTDHYKGIAELCREGMIKELFVFEGYKVSENKIIEDTGMVKENITYLHVGQKVVLNDQMYVEILWPEAGNSREYMQISADETDENSMCLVMKVNIKGRSILVTGDVDSECLDELAKRYGEALNTDILKAAHHGSKYSDSGPFAKAAEPEYVVFQVGRNNFGHPNEGVVENFRQKGIIIHRNDRDGAVAFDFGRKGKIDVKTVKGD